MQNRPARILSNANSTVSIKPSLNKGIEATKIPPSNDLDRGLGKVRSYTDNELHPQHKNREGETLGSGVADTANETEARSKRTRILSYEE